MKSTGNLLVSFTVKPPSEKPETVRQVENLPNILHDGKNQVCNKMVPLVAVAGNHGCRLEGKVSQIHHHPVTNMHPY